MGLWLYHQHKEYHNELYNTRSLCIFNRLMRSQILINLCRLGVKLPLYLGFLYPVDTMESSQLKADNGLRLNNNLLYPPDRAAMHIAQARNNSLWPHLLPNFPCEIIDFLSSCLQNLPDYKNHSKCWWKAQFSEPYPDLLNQNSERWLSLNRRPG